ncbi:MAG TPA: hypothetical protein VGO58_12230 [Chitinophagaceae bacterium]|jgi:hypothetical protein|nr:hypothetical protein [Chitinophagaceae bacterium]
MPSENNHIDNFLRNKASEGAIGASRVDADWQQMKGLLVKPSSVSPKSGTRTFRFKRYLSYAAGVIMVVTTVTIMVLPGKKNNRKTSSTVVTKKPVPVNSKTTTSLGVVSKPTVATKQLTAVTKTSPRQQQPAIAVVKTVKQKQSVPVNKGNIAKKQTLAPVVAAIKPDSKTIFTNFYNELKKPAQEFVINTRQDTTILCTEGSSIFIPAGAFQTIAGLAITGTVRISIQEFYSFADIISNKLSTTSNSMPLETGGMLSINASADNKEVMIRPGSSLDLKMPTRSFDPQMQLFTGQQRLTLMDTVKATLPSAFNLQVIDDTARVLFGSTGQKDIVAQNNLRPASFSGGIDWAPAGQQQMFFADNKKIITLFNTTDNPYYVASYKNDTRVIAKFAIPFRSSITTDEMKEILETKYGRYYDKIKVKRAWRSWVDKNRSYKWTGAARKEKDRLIGDWYDSHFVGDSIRIPLHIACRVKMISPEDSLAWEAKFKEQLETAIKQNKSYNELVQKRNEYNFKITNLGWINCDRFLSYPRSRLTDYVVRPGEGFEGTYFQAIIIFEKERAVMPGYWVNGQVHFVNLPVGHTVHVICAGVKDGKMHASMQTFVVDKFQKPQLKFEETDPEQFREKMTQFGNVKSI